MKKIIVATAAATLMCGAAFAQSSQGNAGPGTMNNKGMEKGSMEKGSMHKGSMTKGSTTGMNKGMKDPNVMPNNQDATGQGTVGPGSNNGMKK
jgi:hypothetical protein